MQLVNLTPHRLQVITESGQILLDLPPCPHPPRVDQEIVGVDTIHTGDTAIPVHVLRYRPGVDLPEPAPDVRLIVPRVLAREAPRADLLFPDEEIRDPDGHIIGCRRLAQFPDEPAERH